MAQTHSLDLERSSSQYASIADASQTGLDLNSSFTVEGWFKFESLPSTHGASAAFGIVSKYLSTGNLRAYGVYVDADTYGGTQAQNRIEVAVSDDGTTNHIDALGTTTAIVTTAELGMWMHLAIAYNLSSRTLTVYKNGRSITTSARATVGTVNSILNNARPVEIGRFNESSSTFDGQIKDLRIFSDIRTQTEVVADAWTEDVSDANLVAEWNFNNAYTDSSGNSNTLTSSGSPVFSSDIPWEAPAGVESSAYILNLVGTSSQGAYTTNNFTQYGTSAVTLEAWVSADTTTGTLMIAGVNDGTAETFQLFAASGGGYTFRVNTGTTADATITRTLVEDGRWHHIAGVYDGSTVKIYLDGIEMASTAKTGNLNTSNPTKLGIGLRRKSDSTNDLFWTGKIKHVRVFSDARTQAEIISDARSSNVSDANLTGEWSLDNVLTDDSGNGNTLITTGSPTFKKWSNQLAGGLVEWWTMDESSGNRAGSHASITLTDNNTVGSATGKKSNAADFEASNSESLSVADTSVLDFSTKLSFSSWINPESVAASNGLLTKFRDSAGNKSYRLHYTTTQFHFTLTSDGSTETAAAWNYVLSTSTWYHVVLTYNAGVAELYVNGISQGRVTGLSSSLFNSGSTFRLGARSNSSDVAEQFMDGLMDEVGIWSRTLEYGDVLDLYNTGSAITYTGSLAALTIDVNDSLTLTESVTATRISNINVSDALTVTESVTVSRVSDVSVSDAISLAESVTVHLTSFPSVSDALTLSESIATEITSAISVVDSLSVAEDVAVQLASQTSISDSLTVSESVEVSLVYGISVNDSLTLTESVSGVTSDPAISVVDTISVAENVALSYVSFVSVTDDLTVSESVTMLLFVLPSVSDALTLSESVETEIVSRVSVSDALSLAESVTIDSVRFSPQIPSKRPRGQFQPLAVRGFGGLAGQPRGSGSGGTRFTGSAN